MSIIVTGANGFIGSHTTRKLLDIGMSVKAVDLSFDNLTPHKNLETYTKDISVEDLSHIIAPGDIVLHLAALAKFADCEADWRRAFLVNTLGTLNVIKSCSKAERVIFSSTGSVYSVDSNIPIKENSPREPRNIYGMSKKYAEDLLMLKTVPYIILRYGYVYGSTKLHGAVGAFIDKLRKHEQPTIFGGVQVNDFTYIDDIVTANLLAIDTSALYEVFNIGTGKGTTVLNIFETIRNLLGSDIQPIVEPLRGTIDFPVFIYDTWKASNVLKFQASYTVRSGIKKTLKELNLI